jgi:tRNA dimethylallyltransferase
MKKLIVCLMGPTASGKTDVAIGLTKHFPCEIISVDSAMVFRGMNIGTAKPDLNLRQKTPHYLIDICDPAENYSVGQFCKDTLHALKEIIANNKIPLLVGGTMMYFRALQFGLSALPSADQTVRQQLDKEANAIGWPALHKRLQTLDPITASRLHPNDAQRIQRALEVQMLTGVALSQLTKKKQGHLQDYEVVNIALIPQDRKHLRERIQKRFHHMLAQGFVDEVKKLYARGDLHKDLSAVRAVGYRQVWDYLAGTIDEKTMIETAIIATQQLAKRQLTWLRQWPSLHTFNIESPMFMQPLVDFLQHKIEQCQITGKQ